MNYAAGILVIAGGAVLIVGIRGSYKNLWGAITGTSPRSLGSSPPDPSSQLTGLSKLAWQDAQNAGIDPIAFSRQIDLESRFNPNAKSPAGAEGIAQFMPGTAQALGVNPWDPVASLKAAATYMASLIKKYGGSEALGLAAYNAGEGTVNNALVEQKATGKPWYDFVPTETQNYVTTIAGGYNV